MSLANSTASTSQTGATATPAGYAASEMTSSESTAAKAMAG